MIMLAMTINGIIILTPVSGNQGTVEKICCTLIFNYELVVWKPPPGSVLPPPKNPPPGS